MNAEEIHKLGLEKVKEISSKIDVILLSQGMTKGTTEQRMAALNNDPKQHYANNDKAKEELIADLNLKVAEVYKKVPEYFNVLPKAKCDINAYQKKLRRAHQAAIIMRALWMERALVLIIFICVTQKNNQDGYCQL